MVHRHVPEIAHVGLTAEAAAADSSICTLTQPFNGNDRAVLEGRTEGFVPPFISNAALIKFWGQRSSERRTGDLISEITVAMTAGCGLKRLASVIHPYPTCADAIRRLGDQYNRTRLTPFVQRLFRIWLKWRF
ncbi:MAG UNVERIFIED_CONTAM: hypothetical protein LVR18_33295 [Planctomycetaceae bacterium]|jgi:pyruvate/2-oxoglutarate dehydrogenase complex dihydrolipoamide dehydrogenase (E3) component